MDKTREREREIDTAIADIRAIEQRDGGTRSSLGKIRQRLIYDKHARANLSWEVALVEQIKRDPAIRFRTYD